MVTVGLCILTRDRGEEVAQALAAAHRADEWDDVLVLDNGSTPALATFDGARWLRSDHNLGVAGGREHLLSEARADVVCFLDDDAVLLTPAVATLRQLFAADPRLAVVAMKVVRADGRVAAIEHPFRGKPRDVDDARPCAWFVGCAYAVRRSTWLAHGGYDLRYEYSTEEADAAFRLLATGHTARYEPSLVVEHRPSAGGRNPAPRVPALRWRNRIWLARRHLPWPVAAAHLTAWGLRTYREARASGDTGPWRGAWRSGWTEPVPRQPLAWRTLWRAHRYGGRVLY